MKSIELSFIISRLCASPKLRCIFALLTQPKFNLLLAISSALLLISIPIAFLFSNFASISVVPDPTKQSRTISFSFVYFKIKFLGICGDQFPL